MIKCQSIKLGDGSSENTFPLRNIGQHNACKLLGGANDKFILVLGGSGPEAMEVADTFPGSNVLCIDRSSKLDDFIQKTKDNIVDIFDLFGVFNDHVKLPKTFYEGANINTYKKDYTNLVTINDEITAHIGNIRKKPDIIMAHSILNNIRAQEDSDIEKIFSEIISNLAQGGILSVADNYELFNNQFKGKKSMTELCEENNLEILYHWPYYLGEFGEGEEKFLGENNNLLIGKKEDNINLSLDVNGIKNYITTLLGEKSIEYIEGDGSYQDYLDGLQGDYENLCMFKTGNDSYFWINIVGKYPEAFEPLFSEDQAFRPIHISEFKNDSLLSQGSLHS